MPSNDGTSETTWILEGLGLSFDVFLSSEFPVGFTFVSIAVENKSWMQLLL